MKVISRSALVQFWERHPEAETTLQTWYRTAKSSAWENFADVRKTFRRADPYRDCVIFDVGGNKYRLIVKIRYRTKRVYIRFVLTHSEYDKGSWKEDCEC
jgi:mRNA interferase HigB